MNAIGGLTPDQTQRIASILKSVPGIKSAVVFGSRAKGSYERGSDIDIALLSDDLTPKDLLCIRDLYDALYLPWKLDVLDYARTKKKELIEHIERVGKKLF
jgi:predicted nucleotidyltransferase